MTRETRTTIIPSDIKAVELECSSCHSRIVRPPGTWPEQILSCPNCGANWTNYKDALARLRNVTFQLRGFSELPPQQDNTVPFTIRFEIAEEEKP